MTQHRLPFAVSHYLCPASLDVSGFLDRVVEHGFSGVGLTQRALLEMPVARLKTELAARDLAVTSVNSAGYFLLTEPEAAAAQHRRNAELIAWTAELGANALNVIVGGAGRLPLPEARARAAGGLVALAERAAAAGIRLVVEPVHPGSLRSKGCFNTVAQVEEAIRGLDAVGLNLDLFHSWWDPDFNRAIADRQRPLGLVQICDVGGHIEGGWTRRLPLGEGDIDWRDAVARVRSHRPEVPIELELFADQLLGREMDEIVASSARLLSA